MLSSGHVSHPRALRLQATALALGVALYAESAGAATIVVNDSGAGSVAGKCTIVDAVSALNNALASSACIAGNGSNDTIDLSFFTAPTTITFALPFAADGNSALQLTKPATIRAGVDGSGQPLVSLVRSAVSGTPRFRLLATSSDLTISGIGFRNGDTTNSGGALYASGTHSLRLDHSSVSGNRADASGGGVAAQCGSVTLTNSTVSGNTAAQEGGGVYMASANGGSGHCSSTIALYTSKVTGNTATTGNGGGVDSFYDKARASYSTIDGNVAGGSFGGGIYARNGVTLIASTVSNNSSSMQGGGIYSHYGYATLTNSTVAHNNSGYETGALRAYKVKLTFSTVAYNTVSPSQSYPFGGIGFQQYTLAVGSLISGNAGDNIAGAGPVNGDHNLIRPNEHRSQSVPTGTILSNAMLSSTLADNGGPTRTLLPQAGSFAIDAGPTTLSPLIPNDQRGEKFARRAGLAADIGAVEVQGNDRVFYDGFGI